MNEKKMVIDDERELLADIQVPYVSQAFEINNTLNPLVAAAAPLLTIATQLREQRQPPELIPLHQSLSHEIKAFENKTRSTGYRSSVILAARYFLCALIDEIILMSSWGEHSRWEQYNLLRTFQRESEGDERFFMILERACEDPQLHIDLLELGYLCVSLGYEGKYRKKNNGRNELGLFLDKLYHLIRDHRGEFSKILFITPPTTHTPRSTRKLSWFTPPLWTVVLITGLVLLGIYLPYHIKLNHLTPPINTSLPILSDTHA